jgi:hypothetical protein
MPIKNVTKNEKIVAFSATNLKADSTSSDF